MLSELIFRWNIAVTSLEGLVGVQQSRFEFLSSLVCAHRKMDEVCVLAVCVLAVCVYVFLLMESTRLVDSCG